MESVKLRLSYFSVFSVVNVLGLLPLLYKPLRLQITQSLTKSILYGGYYGCLCFIGIQVLQSDEERYRLQLQRTFMSDIKNLLKTNINV